MYKIIGADGRAYGPITAEQLRQWVAEGRVNAQTKVLDDKTPEWRPLATFTEFADLFAVAAPSAPPPPPMPAPAPATSPTVPANANATVAENLARDYEVDITGCISRGWQLVKTNLGVAIGTILLYGLLIGGVGSLVRVATLLALHRPLFATGMQPLELMRLQLPGLIANIIWNFLVMGALNGGMCKFYLNLIRSEPAGVGDLFSGFKNAYGALTLCQLARAFLGFIAFLLCIIPAIYVGVAWRFAVPLIVDKRLGFWEAMELSRKVSHKQWWSLFALTLLAGLVAVAGVFACCIGLLVTMPISIAAYLYAYEDIFGNPVARPS